MCCFWLATDLSSFYILWLVIFFTNYFLILKIDPTHSYIKKILKNIFRQRVLNCFFFNQHQKHKWNEKCEFFFSSSSSSYSAVYGNDYSQNYINSFACFFLFLDFSWVFLRIWQKKKQKKTNEISAAWTMV
jgi:hypothetical protein